MALSPVKYSLPIAGLGIGAVVNGQFSANTFDRVRGVFTLDQPGVLMLRWYSQAGALLLEYEVPVCPAMTFASVYQFDVIRQGYYFEYEFTQGGVASTFLRGEVAALND